MHRCRLWCASHRRSLKSDEVNRHSDEELGRETVGGIIDGEPVGAIDVVDMDAYANACDGVDENAAAPFKLLAISSSTDTIFFVGPLFER